MTKASQCEKAEDKNQEFNEKLLNQYIKNPQEAKALYYKEKLKIDINTPEGKEEKFKMFNLYLQGLQWVLLYYYQGVKSWRWYYPYNYAPMISDFDNINFNYGDNNLNKIFEGDKSEPFSPFQSLLFILPKTSFDLLPPCYKEFPNQAPEYFPENVEIDYNGKHTPWEAVVLLPFLDEQKVLELEKKDRKLTKEEEIYDKWGTSFKFGKNELNAKDILFSVYEIYQNKNYDMISNYDKKTIDYTFPTLKTINYDYSDDVNKMYFGKNNVQKTKRITIHPKLTAKIDKDQIFNFLNQKYIFFGYPYKAFGRLEGIMYDKKYYYLHKGKSDNNFRYSNELENIINSTYIKQGIYLTHPDLLCNIAKFIGFRNVNGKMRRNFDEKAKDYPYYVPLEITSLNAVNSDFQNYIYHFNYEQNFEENKKHIKIIKKEEEKPDEINKLNVKSKIIVNEKFKKYPPEVRIDMEKKMKIITSGTTNVSEYRENRIFKDETIEEHQIYYYRNPNSTTKIENPYLIVK